MIEHCSHCDRVRRAGDDWFEPGLIYFKPHEMLDTVCGECQRASAAAAIRDGAAPVETADKAHRATSVVVGGQSARPARNGAIH